MLESFEHNRGTINALVLVAVGVTGTVLDPTGPVGIALFGVAAAAALYLIARPSVSRRRLAAARRPGAMHHRTVVSVVRGRTVAVAAAAMAVLFAVWLTVDISRPLVYACWWAFCSSPRGSSESVWSTPAVHSERPREPRRWPNLLTSGSPASGQGTPRGGRGNDVKPKTADTRALSISPPEAFQAAFLDGHRADTPANGLRPRNQ